MHKRTIKALIDTLSEMGGQLECLVIQGIPMNEGNIVSSLCILLHSLLGLKELRLRQTLVETKSKWIKKIAKEI